MLVLSTTKEVLQTSVKLFATFARSINKMRKVCVECAHKCLWIHGKKKKTSSNVPCSFFKVMIGSDFSKLLYLPPKFGPTASTLVHKEAIIEDSSGQQWKVKISVVDKSCAFQEGWDVFSSDHGLQVGHFLVFHYIGSSHFFVKVFDKSGCEKIVFPTQRKQKKRKTTTIDLEATDDLLHRRGLLSSESDTGKMHSMDEVVGVNNAEINEEETSETSNRRIQSLYKDKNYEDPCYSKDRDLGDKEREDMSPMFDVFRYEILNNSDVHGSGKFTSRNEMAVTSNYFEDPLLEEMLGNGATQEDPFEVELTKRSHFLEELDKCTLSWACERHSCGTKIPEHFPCTMQHEEIKQNNFIMPKWEDQKCQFAGNSETEQLSISKDGQPLDAGNCENNKEMIVGFHGAADAVPMCHVTGEMERKIQKELLNMTPNVCSYHDKLQSINGDQCSNLNSVKVEPSDYGAAHMLASISEKNS